MKGMIFFFLLPWILLSMPCIIQIDRQRLQILVHK